MILKHTFRIVLLLILAYGLWYSYEFVNPWISIIIAALISAYLIDKIINKLKNL
jgi:predicted PurR-regulated permease PerM